MYSFAIKENDLIISCSGTIGKVIIIPRKFEAGIINQALLKLTPSKKIVPTFLKMILEDKNVQNKYFRGYGAGINNVAPISELKQIKIPLPPLEEQKEIVDEIGIIEKEISELKASIIKITEAKKEILNQYLV